MRLSQKQSELLARLPYPPNDIYCDGPVRSTAEALVRKGFARQTGMGRWAGNTYTRILEQKGAP
jgi:hypothetical protein